MTWAVLRRSWATHAPQFGATIREIECVLRHSSSLTQVAGICIQGVRGRILEVLDAYADAVCAGLPEHAELPIEPELLPQKTTMAVSSH